MNAEQGSMLVVDDVEANRDLLSRRLQRQGHTVVVAENGRQALERLREQQFDLILCDIMMPEMNGYQVLEHLKADPALRHIPVIMVSALDDIDSVVRCIELGAEDYLFKPFNPTLLKARINACLEKKRLRDQEQAYLKQLQAEQEKSERLLLSILPRPVAEQLKQTQSTIADSFAEATVLFADIVDFTGISTHRSPIEMVNLLNHIFSAFDNLAEKHGLEKIKTIGDAYMVVGGIPKHRPDHAEAIADMALDMQIAISKFNSETGESFSIRIGISTGPVVAGVIGTKKFIYDLWGDTVNTASRMESHGFPGAIQVTDSTYQCLKDKYLLEERGMIPVKGKGEMQTFLLKGRK
ncbi:response regulator [Leptothermofonsia sichuanensis E412]|uniref:adenylate/guanylate cyclase domain-containing protein n=1 Tax=Leptothermofonsia sichuanensis TaxID=2917832 RepID=UPI001CA65D52|nr:adenylate/guanylate cyclase domain-containing protein [Leptothermofonsia sichuanensis]QZZ19190.1 response regulator [Leptothermofonsia sichuanensis E412]